jgi:hypothetical protein
VPHAQRAQRNPWTPDGLPLQSTATAVAVGSGATIWTGHLDGSVRAHHRGAWDSARAAACRAPIRAIAVDQKGQAWVGDETGQIKALRFDPRGMSVNIIWQALPDGPPVPGASPCTALLSRGAVMVSAGGRSPSAVTLWDTLRFASVVGSDAAAYGALTGTLESIPWPEVDAPAGGGGDWRLLSGHAGGQVCLWEVEPHRLRLVSALGAPTNSAVK